MIVVALKTLRPAFAATVAVADDMRAETCCGFHRGTEVVVGVGVALDEPNLAARAHGARHIEIERGFLGPADVLRRVVSLLAVLIELLEAAIGGRAGRQTEIRAID